MPALAEAIASLSDLFDKVLEEPGWEARFSDLTPLQLHYLRIMIRMNPPTLTELARKLKLTRPTVTVLADRLEERGYVRRVQSDSDRRVVRLHAGEKGIRVAELRTSALQRLSEKMGRALTGAETEQLTELLHKILRVR